MSKSTPIAYCARVEPTRSRGPVSRGFGPDVPPRTQRLRRGLETRRGRPKPVPSGRMVTLKEVEVAVKGEGAG